MPRLCPGSPRRAALDGVSLTEGSASPAQDLFDALGLSYLGPVDGARFETLEEALRLVAGRPGPVVAPRAHDQGPGLSGQRSRRGEVPPRRRPLRPRDRVCRWGPQASLHRSVRQRRWSTEAEAHPEIVAITAAMPGPTGLIAFRDRYPERFFDVGIAEQHAVNAAAGMAMGGLRPVVAIYSTFLNRAWDQVYYDVALHRLPVIFCLDRAGSRATTGQVITACST